MVSTWHGCTHTFVLVDLSGIPNPSLTAEPRTILIVYLQRKYFKKPFDENDENKT